MYGFMIIVIIPKDSSPSYVTTVVSVCGVLVRGICY